MYIARETSKLWRRITAEFAVEWPLLKERWKFILFGIFFQYLHGLATHIVHYLHRPGPVLQDLGFWLLPELGQDNAYISETLFFSIFSSFVLWSFHPFLFYSKRFHTVLLWHRCLAILVISQSFRIASFMVTQLPGPNYHCREGSPTAKLSHPKSISEVILINFPNGVLYGCGDLIFSSHMTFALVFVSMYQRYGTKRWVKQLAWILAAILSLLIIASRKHYSVDVVIAWFTVNLVVFFVNHRYPNTDIVERTTGGGSSPVLPTNMREFQRLINGNSTESQSDRVQRQRNGKIMDDGSPLSEVVLNGTG